MSWQEELDKKFKQLNIRGVTNETKSVSKNRSDSSRNNNSVDSSKYTPNTSNSVGSGSRNLFRGRVSEENRSINNVKKGGSVMITVDAALKDLEVIEQEAKDEGAKAVVKALKVVVKFLSTIRSNQLLSEDDKKRIQAEKATRKTEVK
jgi:hypothetical protein